VAGWWADARAAAVADELAPYVWRDFTDRMLARRFVGAADRYSVLHFLSGLPGASVGPMGPVEPAHQDDPRVALLAGALEARQWRGLSLARLCVDLVNLLDEWQAGRTSDRY
jgi:hypothetical protein